VTKSFNQVLKKTIAMLDSIEGTSVRITVISYFIVSLLMAPSLASACLNGDPNCSGGFLPGATASQFGGGVSEQNNNNIQLIMALASALTAGVAAFQNNQNQSSTVLPGTPALGGYVNPPYLLNDNPNDGTAQ
jgi:hypothetical protein